MFSLYKEKKNHHSDNNKIQVENKLCRSSEAHREEWSSQAPWLGLRRLLHRDKKVWETPSTTGDNFPLLRGEAVETLVDNGPGSEAPNLTQML